MKPLMPYIISFLFLLGGSSIASESQEEECTTDWQILPDPVISFGDTLPGMLWNDPSVLKEEKQYTMWLSGGRPNKSPIVVQPYRATSTDGLNWMIDPIPVLSVGLPGSWDDGRVETPTVIKLGPYYHMYYSGCRVGECEKGKFNIGHAVSPDGITWYKDPEPVIRHHNDPFKWGYYTAAEPAVFYNPMESLIYVYYVSAKVNQTQGYGEFGLVLAISADSFSFPNDQDDATDRQSIWTQSESYPFPQYIGLSTPSVFANSRGQVKLFHDVIEAGWRQGPIAEATSNFDTAKPWLWGRVFQETEIDIIDKGESNWTQHEVRAPYVLEEKNIYRMWFAGHNYPEPPPPGEPVFPADFPAGIGYAWKNISCP